MATTPSVLAITSQDARLYDVYKQDETKLICAMQQLDKTSIIM